MDTVWAKVDEYFRGLLLPQDPALDAAIARNRSAELPAIDVTPLQGRFLELMVRVSGARRVLEIGTLGGYSTIWLARGLPEGGSVLSLEINPRHAEVARHNLEHAGLLGRATLGVGPAADQLEALATSGVAPFDLIFLDADKAGYPAYLTAALRLSRPGTLILADNVVRDGKVISADSGDPDVDGVRRFTDLVAAEPRLSATVLQTVGAKGHDGFALAVVLR